VISKTAYQITDYSSYIKNYMRKEIENMHNCEVCGKQDNEKPMAFRMKPWCSENHRKVLEQNGMTKKV
jgi:hypothetical protein